MANTTQVQEVTTPVETVVVGQPAAASDAELVTAEAIAEARCNTPPRPSSCTPCARACAANLATISGSSAPVAARHGGRLHRLVPAQPVPPTPRRWCPTGTDAGGRWAGARTTRPGRWLCQRRRQGRNSYGLFGYGTTGLVASAPTDEPALLSALRH